MRRSEIRLRKLKLWLRDNHKAPYTDIWQQPLQSALALRNCSATDLFIYFIYLFYLFINNRCLYFVFDMQNKNFNCLVCWLARLTAIQEVPGSIPGYTLDMFLEV